MEIDLELSADERLRLVQEIVSMLVPKLEGLFPSGAGEVMTVGGVADYLQMSSDWVYKQVNANSIPVTRTGKSLRFLKREIDKWLYAQTVQPLALNPASRKLLALRQRNEDCESPSLH